MRPDSDGLPRARSVRGAREAFTDDGQDAGGLPVPNTPDPDVRTGRERLSPSQKEAVRGLFSGGWMTIDLANLYGVTLGDIEQVLAERPRRKSAHSRGAG